MPNPYSVTIRVNLPTDGIEKALRKFRSVFEQMEEAANQHTKKYLENIGRLGPALMAQEQQVAQLVAMDKKGQQSRVTSATQAAQVISKEEKQLAAMMIREARAVTQIREREARQAAKTIAYEEKQLAATMIREARAATRIKEQQTREALRDIQRYEKERERLARDNERAIARLAKQESDTRIREGRRAALELERSLRKTQHDSESTAKGSGSAFTTFLGASFFGNLAANAVSSFFSRARDFVPESTKLAAEAQNALKGLTSVSVFKGIDQAEAEAAVKNLRFVRGGIISIGDASTSVKNLLSTGFGLKESIDLMERFSDASAFGKQSALDYGDAIRGATEGVKNQNSILVDNVGITKNLSVILKERGFQLEDLSDKTKGLAAREALYAGLLAESQAQVGDADKLMQGYTGTIAAQDTAYQNLQRAIGQIVITNPALIESNQIVTEQINLTTRAIQQQDSESSKFADNAIRYWAKIKANLLPFLAFWKNLIQATLQGILVVIDAAIAGVLKGLEYLSDTVRSSFTDVANIGIAALNKLTESARAFPVPGNIFAAIPRIEPFATPQTNLGSNRMFDNLEKAVNRFTQLLGQANKAAEEGLESDKRIDQALELQAYQRRFGSDLTSRIDAEANAARVAEARALAGGLAADTALGTRAGRAATQKLTEVESIERSAERGALKALLDLGREFGFVAGTNQAVAAHNLGSFHPLGRALDFSVKGKSASEISRFMQELTAAGYTVLDERVRPPGQEKWNRPHIHAQFEKGGIPKGLSAEMLEDRRWIEEAARNKAARAIAPIETTEGPLVQLPLAIERKWNQYYEEANRRETQLKERRLDFAAEYLANQKNLTTELGNLELDLTHLRAQNADDQFVEQRGLLLARGEEVDLLRQISRVQDDIANGPYNESLRIQLALLQDIAELRGRDERAIIAANRAQLELSDATIFHATQANAKVLEFLASQRSVTDVIADARIGVIQSTYDVIDRGLDRFTKKLGAIGSMLKDVLSGFIRLALNKAFQLIFAGPQTGGGGLFSGGSPGTGGGLGSVFSNLLGSVLRPNVVGGGLGQFATGGFAGGPGAGAYFGLGGGITTPQAAQAAAVSNIFSNVGNLFGGGVSVPPSATRTLPGIIGTAQGNVAGTVATGASKAGLFGNLAQSLGPLLPLLGAGLGFGLGAPSGVGGILGGIGGLAGGLGALAGLGAISGIAIPGAATALGISSGIPILGSLFAGLGGSIGGSLGAVVAATGPLAVIAIPLLVGAWLLSKSARRKQEEKLREQWSQEVITSLKQMLTAAEAGQLTSIEAEAQFEALRSSYFNNINQLKDSKTKRIATDWWNKPEHPPQVYWKKIAAAAKISDTKKAEAAAFESKFVPTFAQGGLVPYRGGLNTLIKVTPGERIDDRLMDRSWIVPGKDLGRDSVLTIASHGSAVRTRNQQEQEALPAIRALQSGGYIVPNYSNQTVSNQQKTYIQNFAKTIKNEMSRVQGQTFNTSSIFSVINNLLHSDRKEPVQKAIQLLQVHVPQLTIERTNNLKETNLDRFFRETFKSTRTERMVVASQKHLPSSVYAAAQGLQLSPLSRGLHHMPGVFDRKDDLLLRVSGDEHVAVMSPQQFERIGGAGTFHAAGIPKAADGYVSPSPTVTKQAELAPIRISEQHIYFDAAGMVTNVMKTADGRKVIVDAVRVHIKKEGSAGLAGDIEGHLMRR